MIVCIIAFSILALGIIAFILKFISDKLYDKWDTEIDKYAPTLKGNTWTGFEMIKEKNPNYDEKLYNKALKKRKFYANINNDILFGFGMIGCVCGGLFSLILSLVALTENCFQSSNIDYLNMLETRAGYVRELETNPENEHLYQDIIVFNNSLRQTKMCYENPWVSWLNNSKIAKNIDYIEVNDYV